MDYQYKHIIVVHGIGNQAPNETALGFMNEFIRTLPTGEHYKLAVDNLIESVDHLMDANVDWQRHPPSFQPANIVFSDRTMGIAHVIGFSEVYWQPIARYYRDQNDKQLPIPISTWARSIATRLLDPGYRMAQWRAAIENLETMLKLIDKLAFISKKSELFVKVTTDFLGDVEMYAESDEIRQEINKRFFEVICRVREFAESSRDNINMRRKLDDHLLQDFSDFGGFEDIQIYVVAHSEGTVVAYNSLVQAAMVEEGVALHPGDQEFERANKAYLNANDEASKRTAVARPAFHWLPKVAGLVTFGSPLDKHYLIWRSRFRKDRLKNNREQKIPWFNFYDLSDPVAYGLKELLNAEDGAKGDATTDLPKMFDIADKDIGFQRYPIPGKAHVDYWTDPAIYQRIIELMGLPTGKMEALSNGWWAPFQRPLDELAYVLGRALTLLAGLFFANRLLHKLPLEPLLSWGVMKQAHEIISSHPLGPHLWLNYSLWLAVPILAMKFLVEAEQGFVKDREWSPWFRWVLVAIWLASSLVICAYLKPGATSSAISDILGLVATVLVWMLHTTVHRGLIQLWKYTEVP